MPRNRKPLSGLQGVLPATAAVLLALLPAWAADEGEIKFQENVEAAWRLAKADNLPTAIYFNATWCQWCRKMSVSTFPDPKVLALASKMVWAKVDIDKEPDIAAMFGVEGVPAVAMVNAEGELVAMQSGYMTAEQLVKFLNDGLGKLSSGTSLPGMIEKMKAAAGASTQPADYKAALEGSIERLAQPDRAGRTPLLEAIRQLGPGAWEPLSEYLGDSRLAVRSAAVEALAFATGAGLPFDPFAAPERRRDQAQAWRKWIGQNKVRHATAPAAATRPAAAQPQTQPAR